MSADEKPLLVIEGLRAPDATRFEIRLAWIAAALMATVLGCVIALGMNEVVALSLPRPLAICALSAGMVPPALVAAGVLSSMKKHRRCGRFECTESALIAVRGTETLVLKWTDVVGFRDHVADLVELTRKRSSSVFVPTPDDRTRVLVLAFLDAQGIPRHEL